MTKRLNRIAGLDNFVPVTKPLRRGKQFSSEQLVLIFDHCVILGDFTPQSICRLLAHGHDEASVERTLLRFVRREKDQRKDVIGRMRDVPRLVEYDRKKFRGYEKDFFGKCVQAGRTRKQLAQLFHISAQRVGELAKSLDLLILR